MPPESADRISAIAREERAKVARMPQRRKDFYLDGLVALLQQIRVQHREEVLRERKEREAREALLERGIDSQRH